MSRIFVLLTVAAVLLASGATLLLTRSKSQPHDTAVAVQAPSRDNPPAASAPVTAAAPTTPPSSSNTEVAALPPAHATQPVCGGTPVGEPAAFSGRDAEASFCAPGHLVAGSGTGSAEPINWAPDMRFPIDRAPAYANSQVWGVGGTSGPPGKQGDARNYSYPWHDDFCEVRGYATVTCPSGHGHQGQDIRPAACCDAQGHLLQNTFVVDAVEDGQITSIGTYTVYLTGESGRLYRYLHLNMKALKVQEGSRVTRGQPIGYVSNYFGNSVTTFHLHFEIKAPVSVGGRTVYTWVSPYPSLVASYARLLDGNP